MKSELYCDPALNRLFVRLWLIVGMLAVVMLVAAAWVAVG